MRYIANNTNIPIPQIHNIETHDGGTKSISMDYIEGRTLENAWLDMVPSRKIAVAQELHGFILQLRELRRDSNPTRRGNARLKSHTREFMPSSDLIAHFNPHLILKLDSSNPIMPQHGPFGPEDKLVFTHGDIAPRNIIIDEEGHVAAVLDWEYAGWYPVWWEFVKAYEFCNDLPGWSAYLSIILPPSHAKEYMSFALATRFAR
ncbi:hypothetical protein N7452_000208 [Penicillium brevicompactum]|uniref:Aminoglycoside phosphotransferase domain-containing protein n=1 Tax=Penicillium brevicompactum TaxID=5074 RepID=A0A9W9UNV3_PENBR|nr:hypothetical protein N7452_000208 [Penicillium brevicompactum]